MDISNLQDYLDPRPYLGYLVENKLTEIKEIGRFSEENETDLRGKCSRFVVALIIQLKQRLPDNYKILQKVDLLSVTNTLKQLKDNITLFVIGMGHDAEFAAKVEIQWQKITLIPWENKSNTLMFWAEILKYRNAANENPFAEISSFAISMLSLPWSNGEVERVFSQLNLFKNKSRNRLSVAMINAILTVRSGLKRKKYVVMNTSFQEKS
ncbi:hypothetical protein ACJJTC_018613 [Scirpophaga incertulas]